MEVAVHTKAKVPGLDAATKNLASNSISQLGKKSSQAISKSGSSSNYSSASVALGTSRTPVRITTIPGSQVVNMAKSSGLSVVHVSLPQTVIQSPSVIQSAAGQIQLPKGNVILVPSKGSSVIQTAGGVSGIKIDPQQLVSQINVEEKQGSVKTSSGDKKRREILSRRPSYRKILNDLGEVSSEKIDAISNTSESSQDTDSESTSAVQIGGTTQSYPAGVVKILPSGAVQLGSVSSAEATSVSASALQTITMTNAGTGGTIVHYSAPTQDGQHQLYVPVGNVQAYTVRPVSSTSPSVVVTGNPGGVGVPSSQGGSEDQTRKREIRLLKNREAARECRRKKKEYIKCLENRVAVLENQNKALIDELKSLKELYCQHKTD